MLCFDSLKRKIKIGDVFLSSAIGSKFPAGYPVGRVTHVEKKEHNPFLTIHYARF
jgi:rod shape-determining protein MreC